MNIISLFAYVVASMDLDEITTRVVVQIICDVLKMAARAVVKALRELIRQYKRSRAYGKHACKPRKRHADRRR